MRQAGPDPLRSPGRPVAGELWADWTAGGGEAGTGIAAEAAKLSFYWGPRGKR